MPKEGAEINEISDIGEVADDDLPADESVLSNATVVGAVIHSYYKCIACDSKVEPLGELYKCSKCQLEQLGKSCAPHLSSTLHLCSGTQYYHLTAFKNILTSILKPGDEISTTNLLKAPPFTCNYENKIITCISRQ